MHAMQYEVTLPADYDMNIIRARVATNGHRTDHLPGLGLKAYCVRIRGEHGASVHQYAPFYLWAQPAGMTQFLLGAGFQGLTDAFGRPEVRPWVGLGFQPGPAFTAPPIAASRRVHRISRDADLRAAVQQHLDQAAERALSAHVHSTAAAVDPHTWEVVHFTLWAQHTPNPDDVQYAVLHLSSPSLDALASG